LMGEGMNVIAAARLAASGIGVDETVSRISALVERT